MLAVLHYCVAYKCETLTTGEEGKREALKLRSLPSLLYEKQALEWKPESMCCFRLQSQAESMQWVSEQVFYVVFLSCLQSCG